MLSLMETSPAATSSIVDLLRVKELEEQQKSLLKSVICGFNQLLDLRDLNTGIHSTRLAEWAVRVARQLRLPEADFYQIEVAALLHDIGKIGVPDSILKKEGKLTDEERALMNKHPEYSWSILRLFAGLDRASLYALHHHESFDGTGYPGTLKGEEIPIGSRIANVTLRNPKGFAYAAVTDAAGHFLIENIEPGSYQAMAASDGFIPDQMFRRSALASALITVAEEHPGGKQMLCCRLRARWSLQARVAFWTVCGVELLALGLLGSSMKWLWFILLSLPLFAWFFQREKRSLQSVIVVFLDDMAKEWKLVKAEWHDIPAVSAPVAAKPDPKSPFRQPSPQEAKAGNS